MKRAFPVVVAILVAVWLCGAAWAADDSAGEGEAPSCFAIDITGEKLTIEADRKVAGRFILYWSATVSVNRSGDAECPKTPTILAGNFSLSPLGRWSLAGGTRFIDKPLKPGINTTHEKIALASIDVSPTEYKSGLPPRWVKYFDKGQLVQIGLQVRNLASGTATEFLSQRQYTMEPLTFNLVPTAADGDLSLVREALAKGAEVNSATFEDWTALMAASAGGHAAVVRLLLDKGAKVNVTTRGSGYAQSVLGSRIPAGSSALMVAALKGNAQIVQMLLAKGADVNQRRSDLWTPLMAAAYSGNSRVVRLLLDKGARTGATNELGYSAMAVAAVNGHRDVATLLKNRGDKLEVPWGQ